MRGAKVLVSVALTIALASANVLDITIYKRDNVSTPDFPKLTTNNPNAPTQNPAEKAPSSTVTPTAELRNSTSIVGSITTSVVPTQQPTTISSSVADLTASDSTPTTSDAAAAATSAPDVEVKLPLQPAITPAFSIAGAVLILSGIIYAVIGVKNLWIQVFLSTGYLSSLSITVLICYVMNPPISNAIQGAYFVGIFMTGLIIGAGALIFKEVTEGFGCLLGGFCLSMFFLTLKDGGLITNREGKGIFIAVFSCVIWALSFSHYTRSYALIGSTSFSGATAFVLGIDCFSKGGLKEFWVYLWALNDNIFPLNTNTYPITKGIRVELIVTVLACLIGIMSQIKLWKVVRDRQKKREAIRLEDERRKEVVEEAIGRHLQRQNDRDRSAWEKQYGDRLQSKRNTVLWADAHPDKRLSDMSTQHVIRSSDSVELSAFGSRPPSAIWGPRRGHQSVITVAAIPESEEDEKADAVKDDSEKITPDSQHESTTEVASDPDESKGTIVNGIEILETGDEKGSSSDRERRSTIASSAGIPQEPDISTMPSLPVNHDLKQSKRRSFQEFVRNSLHLDPVAVDFSESKEALVIPHYEHSRASSMAATLDEDNDQLDIRDLDVQPPLKPPTIVVSPVIVQEAFEPIHDIGAERYRDTTIGRPVSIGSESDADFDPEELARARPLSNSTKQRASVVPSIVKHDTITQQTAGSPIVAEGQKNGREPSETEVVPESSSNAEKLTQDALKQVSSQASNIILNYRTNEWAKHVSTAEIPVFEEPEVLVEVDDEIPVQVETRTPAEIAEDARKEAAAAVAAKRRSASNPASSMVDVDSTDLTPRAIQRSFSDQQTSLVPPMSSAVFPPPSALKSPTFGKSGRITPNAFISKQSLVTSPIDENYPTDFSPPIMTGRRTSITGPVRVPSRSSVTSAQGISAFRPAPSSPQPGLGLQRSASYTSLSDAMSLGSPHPNQYSNLAFMQSETRLQSYNSHQPSTRDQAAEGHKRAQMLADWRQTQQQAQAGLVSRPRSRVDGGLNQMLQEKEQRKYMEDQYRAAQHMKQMEIDQVMRRPDMQDLHREALRKMQAGANKQI